MDGDSPSTAKAGKWLFWFIVSYVFLGIGMALVAVVWLDESRFVKVWEAERAHADLLAWPLTSDQRHSRAVRIADGTTEFIYNHIIPPPDRSTSGIGDQINQSLESAFKSNPAAWYPDRVYPNLQWYLRIIMVRGLLIAFALGLALPIGWAAWRCGQATARRAAREATMPATHRFRLFAGILSMFFVALCTWVFLPLSVTALWAIPAAMIVIPLLMYRIRVHGIEM